MLRLLGQQKKAIVSVDSNIDWPERDQATELVKKVTNVQQSYAGELSMHRLTS